MFVDYQILILVISEGSCDTEDWSNAALITGINILLYFTVYSHRKQLL